jgi:hypothetical protein
MKSNLFANFINIGFDQAADSHMIFSRPLLILLIFFSYFL